MTPDRDPPIPPTLEGIATAMRYFRKDMREIEVANKEAHTDIKQSLKADYVKKAEFTPVKNLVYGFVGLALTGVIVALLSRVVTAYNG
jgi:hypothetical protein